MRSTECTSSFLSSSELSPRIGVKSQILEFIPFHLGHPVKVTYPKFATMFSVIKLEWLIGYWREKRQSLYTLYFAWRCAVKLICGVILVSVNYQQHATVWLRSIMQTHSPFECRGNYSATSNNMKLVRWPLMGGLLHLVQRAEDWGRDCSRCRPLLAVPNVTAHPSTASVSITVLFCGFNMPTKG